MKIAIQLTLSDLQELPKLSNLRQQIEYKLAMTYKKHLREARRALERAQLDLMNTNDLAVYGAELEKKLL
jgi:hypothetical protein